MICQLRSSEGSDQSQVRRLMARRLAASTCYVVPIGFACSGLVINMMSGQCGAQ
jgi:hypothetical protein